MKERPILMSAPMVRALLEGRKTQTRRVITKPRWAEEAFGLEEYADGIHCIAKVSGCSAPIYCPYGKPGDRLWVRETFYAWRCTTYSSSGVTEGPEQYAYAADGSSLLNGAKWKPSIHMPRWASRITLEITGVRVQRLQEISQEDARAEGFGPRSAKQLFRGFWKIEEWDTNPWVWAISFQALPPS